MQTHIYIRYIIVIMIQYDLVHVPGVYSVRCTGGGDTAKGRGRGRGRDEAAADHLTPEELQKRFAIIDECRRRRAIAIARERSLEIDEREERCVLIVFQFAAHQAGKHQHTHPDFNHFWYLPFMS